LTSYQSEIQKAKKEEKKEKKEEKRFAICNPELNYNVFMWKKIDEKGT